jgi:cell migration-inducing and hyaluronan-binding protein
MAGVVNLQRQTMTVNNGVYYLDTSVGDQAQTNENPNFTLHNDFIGGQQYTIFLLSAKKSTKQTYQIYVGNRSARFTPTRVAILGFPLQFQDQSGGWATASPVDANGIMTVTIDLSNATDLEPSPAQGLCQPRDFCVASGNSCVSNLQPNDPRVLANASLKAEADYICGNWAMKDLDCPKAIFGNSSNFIGGGCYGFSFTLPGNFNADGMANRVLHRPPPDPFPNGIPDPKHAPDWMTTFANTTTLPDSKSGEARAPTRRCRTAPRPHPKRPSPRTPNSVRERLGPPNTKTGAPWKEGALVAPASPIAPDSRSRHRRRRTRHRLRRISRSG